MDTVKLTVVANDVPWITAQSLQEVLRVYALLTEVAHAVVFQDVLSLHVLSKGIAKLMGAGKNVSFVYAIEQREVVAICV